MTCLLLNSDVIERTSIYPFIFCYFILKNKQGLIWFLLVFVLMLHVQNLFVVSVCFYLVSCFVMAELAESGTRDDVYELPSSWCWWLDRLW